MSIVAFNVDLTVTCVVVVGVFTLFLVVEGAFVIMVIADMMVWL